MEKNFYSFPAFFFYDDDGISVEFPDLPGCLTCAQTSEEAFRRAKDALGLHLYGMEADGDPIPAPTPVDCLHPEDGGVLVLVEAYMPAVRDRIHNRSVKKTLTLPAWLNREAEAANINFSQVLQEGLKQRLGVQ